MQKRKGLQPHKKIRAEREFFYTRNQCFQFLQFTIDTKDIWEKCVFVSKMTNTGLKNILPCFSKDDIMYGLVYGLRK